jgi:hypothetical protein
MKKDLTTSHFDPHLQRFSNVPKRKSACHEKAPDVHLENKEPSN